MHAYVSIIKMEDNPTFTVKFVEIVEKYNVLYDHTMEGYSNRHVQEKAWNEVGKEINETGAACKEKWKNLRFAYVHHLKQKPPSGSSAQAKKKYYLADHLDFLLPFTKSRQQKGSIPSPKNINEETCISTEEESTEIEPREVHDENDLNKDAFEESSTNEPLLVTESALTRNKSSTKKRKEVDPLEKCAIDYFTSKSRGQSENPEDANLLFLKSLLPDLQRMTNAQKHEFKYKTMQVIGEILYKPPPNNFTPLLTHSQQIYNSSNISFRPPSVLSNSSQAQTAHSSSQISTPMASPDTPNVDYDILHL